MDEDQEDRPPPSPAEEALLGAMKQAYEAAVAIEPAAGKVHADDVARLAGLLATIPDLTGPAFAEMYDDDVAGTERSLAIVYARCAAVAIAGADEAAAQRWLTRATEHAPDELRDELAAAHRAPERYRALVHGRNLFVNGRERAARAIWKTLAQGENDAHDALAKAAGEELAAPRPLNGKMPSLWTYNGFGLRFSGKRDEWADGSYATTQCVSALWIPLFPIASYRVADDDEGGWYVLAREQLSKLARVMRYAIVLAIVGGIAFAALRSHLNDPTRLARKHFDDTFERVAAAEPSAALGALDGLVTAPDAWRYGRERMARAGAVIVQRTAALAPAPFTAEHVDHANRLVVRFNTLPEEARTGAARDAIVDALEGWLGQLGAGPATADARLALLVHAAAVADARRSGPLTAKVTAARLEVADARAEDWPLDALAMLVEQPHAEALARATKIVERLAASPSMLAEAGADLDRWLAASPAGALREDVVARREQAVAARAELEAEELPLAKLQALAKARPWDQRVAVRIASAEAIAGKLEAAEARLTALGTPGMMILEARLLLGQLSSALGKLEQADALLSSMLAGRLPRFQAASAALDAAMKQAEKRVMDDLRLGNIPADLEAQAQYASPERQRELVQEWGLGRIQGDPAVTKAREDYAAVADIVEVALAAGTVKLRRAQGASGAARDELLRAAERTFLAIRSAAEGQPEFRLALGEIYARLGKAEESKAEFDALLAEKVPAMSLRVATVFRNIGSVERAREVAKEVFELRDTSTRDHAVTLLGILSRDDDEAGGWYAKGDPNNREIKIALLEVEGRKLYRQGAYAECAAKFAQTAKLHLADGGATVIAGLNNAAVAHAMRYRCSGDTAALRDAETQYEKAYKLNSEQPIVVSNLASQLDFSAELRLLGKRLDLRALRLDSADSDLLVATLLEGPEHGALLAELAADPGARRSGELYAQYEVLAPNSTSAYLAGGKRARLRRDEAALVAIVARARQAKGLDTSEMAAARAAWISGASDAEYFEGAESEVARLDKVLAQPRLDARTRAAASLLLGRTLHRFGLFRNQPDALARGCAATADALRLWPALAGSRALVECRIDEGGVAADATAWIAARRVRGAVAALAKLAADGAPLAAAIQASKAWTEAAGAARADTTRPSVETLRFARLLRDAALEARAQAALDDRVLRATRELDVVLDPGQEASAEDLAYLDRR